MAVPARVSLITLGVADLDRATAFYEALGWKRSAASAEGVSFFRTADSALALFGHDDLAKDAQLPRGELPAYRGFALAINVESEAEVDRVLAEAVAAGATMLKPAGRAFWGGYTGYFTDPEGHAWEVAHNPHWTFTADGSVDLPQ